MFSFVLQLCVKESSVVPMPCVKENDILPSVSVAKASLVMPMISKEDAIVSAVP